MPLTLTITSYQRLSPGQTPKMMLSEGELNIGRGPENDWVLPDPEMVVSKKHCVVSCQNGEYILKDISTNGVFVNNSETSLGKGNSTKLNNGDEFIIGDYEIQVALNAVAEQEEAAYTPGLDEHTDIFSQAEIGPLEADKGDLRDDLIPDSPRSEPLAAEDNDLSSMHDDPLLGGDGLKAPNQQDAYSAGQADVLGLNELSNSDPLFKDQHSEADHLPAHEEFFRAPNASPDPVLADSPQSSENLEPEADDASKAASGTEQIPENFFDDDSMIHKIAKVPASDANTDTDPFAFEAEEEIAPVQENQNEALENEPLENAAPDVDLVPDERPADSTPAPSVASLMPEPTPEPAAEQSPPRKATEQMPAADLAPAATPDVASGQPGTAAIQAFLHGAGLSANDIVSGDPIRFMQTLGEVFRQSMEGMMDLLRARGSVKNEFRLERTVVGPIQNNPLKILPSFEEAANAMLSKSGKNTWMPAKEAIKESLDDVKAHELAMVAGMEAALTHLLKTFDPATLEQEFSQDSMLSSIMPGARKAKYWDAFTALYGKIVREAEDDFQNFFRKEFARAYEKQQRKLKETG